MEPFRGLSGCTVRVVPGEPLDSLMRRWKKASQRAGVLADARRHEFYVPRAQRRRQKSAVARKR
jgi:small subunit ribosomal protein S21